MPLVTTQPPSSSRDPAPIVDREDLKVIRREFSLGEVHGLVFLPNGVLNRNWRIQTGNGDFALKLLHRADAKEVSRSARVLTALARLGLPVPTWVPTRGGEPLLQIGPRSYGLSHWADGTHLPGRQLSLEQAAEFGTLVADLQRVLNDPLRVPLPGTGPRPQASPGGVESALATVERLAATCRALPNPTPFDTRALDLLERRRELLAAHAGHAPSFGPWGGPYGWTHGDLGWRNILHHHGQVSAVLDWDRLAVRSFAHEVARTAVVQFDSEDGVLDLARVAAFVRGYRAATPLPRMVLAQAVERLWWKHLVSFWIFEFHYDQADASADVVLEPVERLAAWWSSHRGAVQDAFAS
ncbi:hypothetical protein FE633_42925 [Streptomyces montanus]|uniref:Aminoglycoside phosphotransferase domain-containing protein n=1 Tax=Streptomyces montanus TaxID=2580423 RepID=A0A5R9FDB1_9ACTN|nr:hypothetical protein FE633_42925 [Streptomyces montanus]